MISLMFILLAVFAFVCAYFFLEAEKTPNATIVFSVGIILIILFMVGFFNFINYLLEVLRWTF